MFVAAGQLLRESHPAAPHRQRDGVLDAGRATLPGANPAGPWHRGELVLQQQTGVAEKMDAVGRRVIRDHLIEQHRLFYSQLPFIVLGSVDEVGDAWATIRAGRPGFLSAPEANRLDVMLAPDPIDPADAGIEDGRAVALLGIELHTRRRNRLNGTIHRTAPSGFSVAVEQSFGNCPQYIHRREFRFVREPTLPSPPHCVTLSRLNGRAADMVRTADTFFVASYVTDDDGHLRPDVSHRGRERGFVQIGADGGLTIPDYSGNRFFNTLGNILVNPRAGLVFVDFETGDMLQLTGHATISLDAEEAAGFSGAERLWHLRPNRILMRPQALPLRWIDIPNTQESR